MKLALALASLAVTAAAKIDLASYTFEQFKADFGKQYPDRDEETYREKVFRSSLADAIAHNADETQTWRKSVNQFSDRTTHEFRNSHGWLPSSAAGPNVKFQKAPPLPTDFKLSDLPDSIDWREKGVVTPIKNQGLCGSCWAFASTETIESYVALNGSLIELSPQNLVSCDTNPNHCGGKGGCRGSIPELAFNFVAKNGIASEAEWPYVSGSTSNNENCTAHKPAATIEGWVKLEENNYAAVMNALATVGPLAINVDAIPMQSYGGGLFTGCGVDKTHIDHVVQLVGYGFDTNFNKPYWIIRNSWGNTWGDEGWMYLERHPDTEWCSYDIYPADGTGCDGGPGTVWSCGSCGVLYDVSYVTGAHAL